MLIVPLQPVASQTVNAPLGNQPTTLNVYQKDTGLFMDVYVNGSLIIGGVICNNADRIVRNAYLGFVGDFVWIDTQDASDPYYTGIGSRWFLAYLEAADVVGVDT